MKYWLFILEDISKLSSGDDQKKHDHLEREHHLPHIQHNLKHFLCPHTEFVEAQGCS
jgi:hypothetical protein